MMESQFNYIVDALKTMTARNLAAIDVTAEAVDAFTDEIQAKLTHTVWASGCSSWYLDASGRNTSLWPDFTWQYRLRTRHFDPDRYVLTRAS
jgi:hypothetical protein